MKLLLTALRTTSLLPTSTHQKVRTDVAAAEERQDGHESDDATQTNKEERNRAQREDPMRTGRRQDSRTERSRSRAKATRDEASATKNGTDLQKSAATVPGIHSRRHCASCESYDSEDADPDLDSGAWHETINDQLPRHSQRAAIGARSPNRKQNV
jgi:hypothetical protein